MGRSEFRDQQGNVIVSSTSTNGRNQPVGTKAANPHGFEDKFGIAWEFVGDRTCVGSSVEPVHANPHPFLPGLEFWVYAGNQWIDLGDVGGPS